METRKDWNGSQIKIVREDGDYTEFIMRLINKLIEVTQDHQGDSRGQTNFEKFREFNEELFWLTNCKEFNESIKKVS